jgi:hypothetical protein
MLFCVGFKRDLKRSVKSINLRISENEMLRIMCGSEGRGIDKRRKEMTFVEHNDLFCPCHRSGMTVCARHITRIGERKNAFKVLVGKHERRRLGRHRRRWRGSI